jgi:hypothetical protein
MSDIEETNEVIVDKKSEPLLATLGLIAMIWAILGLLAFFMSILCFRYEGTVADKFLGLVISVVLGPIYWLYYAYGSKDYCASGESSDDGPSLPARKSKSSVPPAAKTKSKRTKSKSA